MSENVQGVVGWAGGKKYGNKQLFSVKLEGVDTWFRCGTIDPNVAQGDEVKFTFSDVKGNAVIDMDTFEQVVREKPEPKSSGSTTTKPTTNNYTQNADDKQKIITYQAAHNTATAIVAAAASVGALKLGAQAKQFDNLREIVFKLADELAVRYLNAPATVDKLLSAVQEAVEDVTEESAEGGIDDE